MKHPKLEVKYVEHLGEVGCGTAVETYDNVIPFIAKSELFPVALPPSMNPRDVGILTVRGLSLTDFNIFDGDSLVITKKFSWRDIDEDTICVVYIHATGELVAKRIIRGANTLILRASGGGIPDREYAPDEIEIRGIVLKVEIDIAAQMMRSRESKSGHNGRNRATHY